MSIKTNKFLLSGSIRDSLEQTRSEMKEIKQKLDTLAASLEENKDEGQS